MRAIWVGAVLAVGVLCAPGVRAGEAWDELELKNGRVLSGSVSRKGAFYEVRRAYGSILIPVEEVREVVFTRDPLDELRRMRALGFPRGSADQRFQYATLLAKLGQRRDYTRAYQSVLRVDPNHPGANLALGRVFHEGTWMTAWERDRAEAAKKRALGFVLYKGEWLLPAERDRRAAAAAKAAAKAAKEAALRRAAEQAREDERRRAQAAEDAKEAARQRARAQEAEVARLRAQVDLERAQAQRAAAATERAEAERAALRARRRNRFAYPRPGRRLNARRGREDCSPWTRGSDRRPRNARGYAPRTRGSDRRPRSSRRGGAQAPGFNRSRRTQPAPQPARQPRPARGPVIAPPRMRQLPLGAR